MRRLLIAFAVTAALTFGLLVPRGSSAPALPDKPVRYEFAELRYYQVAGAGGKNILVYRWTTADDDFEGLGWEGMASRLKAPETKQEGPYTHRLRVFNAISRDGWQDVPHRNESNVWVFRRRVQ